MGKKLNKFSSAPYLTGLYMPIETKAVTAADSADQEDLLIEGYASKISKDRVGDIVVPSAFQEAIASFLESPILLYMHDKTKPIGAVSELFIDGEGVRVKGFISAASKFAKDEVIPLVKKKILNSFSIGFIPKEGRYEPKDDSYIITKGELLEISIVSVPANRDTKFSVAKEFVENPEFDTLRESWKSLAEQHIKSINNEEKNRMDKLEQLEAQLKDAMTQSAKLKAELDAKEKSISDLAVKAAKLDELQKAEEIKKAETEAARQKAEREELTKQLADLKTALEKTQTDIAEAKAIAAKGGTRIEFSELPQDQIWKEYGDTLDGVWLASQMLKKSTKDLVTNSTYQRLPEQVKTMTVDAAFQTLAGRRIWEDIRANSSIVQLFDTIELPTDTYNLPFDASAVTAEWVAAGNTSSDNTLTINPIVFSAYKLMAKIWFNYEDEADSLIPVVAQARKNLVNAMSDTLDATIMTGNGTGKFRGLEHYAANATGTAGLETEIAGSLAGGSKIVASDIYNAMVKMKKYAFKRNDLVVLLNFLKYAQIVGDTNVTTVDKYGPSATIHTGEVAKVYGKPIVVSDFVTGVASASGYSGMLVYTPGFLVGWRNNMMVEVDKNVETQKNLIVFSLRADFRPIYPHVAQIDSDDWPIIQALQNKAS